MYKTVFDSVDLKTGPILIISTIRHCSLREILTELELED